MYRFPKELSILAEWMAGHGVDLSKLASDRQAAWRAQKMVGSHFKFPDPEYPCFSVLAKIQEVIIETPNLPARDVEDAYAYSVPVTTKPVKAASLPIDPAGIVIFVDGSAAAKGKPGGYAFVLTIDGKIVHEFSDRATKTTTNEAELMALWSAIWHVDRKFSSKSVRIYSHSEYAIDSTTKWWRRWEKAGWKLKKNKTIANVEIIREIVGLLKKLPGVQISWIPGYSNEPAFCRAAELAEQQRVKHGPANDNGVAA